MDVISRLDFGTNKLLEGPARSLSEGAQTVTGVAGNLDLLSGSLREIADILGKVGDALNGLGDKLSTSGHSVAGLMSQPLPPDLRRATDSAARPGRRRDHVLGDSPVP